VERAAGQMGFAFSADMRYNTYPEKREVGPLHFVLSRACMTTVHIKAI